MISSYLDLAYWRILYFRHGHYDAVLHKFQILYLQASYTQLLNELDNLKSLRDDIQSSESEAREKLDYYKSKMRGWSLHSNIQTAMSKPSVSKPWSMKFDTLVLIAHI